MSLDNHFVDAALRDAYSGWRNWVTWNVALWLSKDYPHAMRGYKGYVTPYLSLRRDLMESFGFTQTRDGANLWASALDIEALDTFITEQ